jgi:hypothetical protein
LEDQGCGDLVNDATVRLPVAARFVQHLVRFVRRQALIPQMNGKLCELAQLRCECLDLCGLRTDFSGKFQWIANDDPRHRETAAKTSQRFEIFPRTATALQGEDWLRCQPKFVRNRNANALRTDIKGEKARRLNRIRHWNSSKQSEVQVNLRHLKNGRC